MTDDSPGADFNSEKQKADEEKIQYCNILSTDNKACYLCETQGRFLKITRIYHEKMTFVFSRLQVKYSIILRKQNSLSQENKTTAQDENLSRFLKITSEIYFLI